MQYLTRDLSQIIYHYCDITTLYKLSLISKKYYSFSDKKYYQKRIEDFYHITPDLLDFVVETVYQYLQKPIKGAKKYNCDTELKIYKILKSYSLEKLSQFIKDKFEKYPFSIYLITSEAKQYYRDETDDFSHNSEYKPIYKKLSLFIYLLRSGYFQIIKYKNNITYLPKIHYIFDQFGAELSTCHCSLSKLTINNNLLEQTKIHLFDLIINVDISVKYFVCYKQISSEITITQIVNCLKTFEIRNKNELELLYSDINIISFIEHIKFLEAKIVNKIYFASFKIDDNIIIVSS